MSTRILLGRRDRALDLTAHSVNVEMVTARDGNMNIRAGQSSTRPQ